VELFRNTTLLINDINDLIDSADDEDNSLPKGKRKREKLIEELKRLRDELVTRDDIRYPQPKLSDQIMYLYSMIGRADQKPGRDAYTRFNELTATFEALSNQYDGLME